MGSQNKIVNLEALNWRDEQYEAIFAQLEAAFPDLLDRLANRIDHASYVDLVKSSLGLQNDIKAILKIWTEQQAGIALSRTKASLEAFLLSQAHDDGLDPERLAQLWAALPAFAGFGLAALSLAAVPTIISFATVTTSTFAIFSTTAVSWPLFAVGVSGLAVTAYFSRGLIDNGVVRLRDTLKERTKTIAAAAVFGLGAKPGKSSILEDIQKFAIDGAITFGASA